MTEFFDDDEREAPRERKKSLIVLALPALDPYAVSRDGQDGFNVRPESFMTMAPDGKLLIATDCQVVLNDNGIELYSIQKFDDPATWRHLARIYEYRPDHCVVIASTFPAVKAIHEAGCHALWARGYPGDDALTTCFHYAGKNMLGLTRPTAEVVKEIVFAMPEPEEPGPIETGGRHPRPRFQ